MHIPLVATGDVHYTKPSESGMQKILHNLRGGNKKTLEEMEQSWGYDIPPVPAHHRQDCLRTSAGYGAEQGASHPGDHQQRGDSSALQCEDPGAA